MSRRAEAVRSLSTSARVCWLFSAGIIAGCYATLDPISLGQAECIGVTVDTRRYAICPTPLDHAAAANDCALRRAHLLAMNSAEENSAVATAAFTSVNSSNLWLGGTRTEDFVWSWPDGSVFWRGGREGSAEPGAFVLWQAGEPNNSSSTGAEAEACLALTVENADWNDRSCSLSLPYVCELD